ncbi:hypothetical protein CBR_g16871 [Chara braunii]|uniref:Phosphoribosylformylglycinamidine cyclo-ligase n=1 Tax=Chara braunii TaxID=69332 RepID=A0A388KU54_CHABU|nr:hypothetical protein CBR_g16871 [Chara braunii]|eukprot:GBG73528.1 hypothetical protein CBR_g16871 [Chara braunii]
MAMAAAAVRAAVWPCHHRWLPSARTGHNNESYRDLQSPLRSPSPSISSSLLPRDRESSTDLLFSTCHCSSSSSPSCSNRASPVLRGLAPPPSSCSPQPQFCTKIRPHGSLWLVPVPIPIDEKDVQSRGRCHISSSFGGASSSSLQWPACTPSVSSSSRRSAQARRTMMERSSGDGGTGLTYKEAGVDIDAGAELVKRIAAMVPGIGGFGGLYPFGDSYLVAGTDGVGTKLKLAFELDIHNTIGIDLVAMSVNDIVTSGAKPLFFLDYFATSRLDVDAAAKVIAGIVEGCRQSDCALLGGETAEMPGFYADGEYDLSGFAVGAVKRDEVIDGSGVEAGDIILGLASSGVHSNGFSLVRRVLEKSGASLYDVLPGIEESAEEGNNSLTTIGASLLTPTVIYVKQIMDIIGKVPVKGIAHITGGGFTDNIPRILPDGLAAKIDVTAWEPPRVFQWIQQAGQISDNEMRRTFNMGIGMAMVVSPSAAEEILSWGPNHWQDLGPNPIQIGEVVPGNGVIYASS